MRAVDVATPGGVRQSIVVWVPSQVLECKQIFQARADPFRVVYNDMYLTWPMGNIDFSRWNSSFS